MKEDWIYKRGDLYYANLNPYFGSEQGGTRPVLVLQNNVGNFFCPTLIVAPLTSKWIKKKELPTHYALESVPELGLKSVVLLEQIKTIDKRRVLSYIFRRKWRLRKATYRIKEAFLCLKQELRN